MYLLINDKKYTVSKRIVSDDTIKYLSVTPEIEDLGEISGTIQMYTDEDFLLSEDNIDDYGRRTFTGTLLTITNQPEIVYVPQPESPYVTWVELQQAISSGVNEI